MSQPDGPWPCGKVAYEDPPDQPSNRDVWRQAVTDAFAARTLTVTLGDSPRVATLSGACPRCGHPWRDRSVYYAVIVPREITRASQENPVLQPQKSQLGCTCTYGHDGQGNNTGCGWAARITVTIPVPETQP